MRNRVVVSVVAVWKAGIRLEVSFEAEMSKIFDRHLKYIELPADESLYDSWMSCIRHI